MIKVLLFLTVFTPAHGWQRLTNDPPQEFPSVAECTAAAAKFLEPRREALSEDVPAIGAECVVGNDKF